MDLKELCLSNEQWAWLAGLIDGEGSITIYMQRDYRHGGHIRMIPQVSIANSCIPLLDKIKEMVECGTVSGGRRRNSNFWHADTKGLCKQLLENTLPWLIARKYPAELVLDFCNRGNGTYTQDDLLIFEKLKKYYYQLHKWHGTKKKLLNGACYKELKIQFEKEIKGDK